MICGLTELDCQFNAASLVEKLFKNEPSMWEYHTCNIEATQTVVPKIFIPIDLEKIAQGM